jgi:hypothetical protein
MGEACSTYGRNGKCIKNFGRENWREDATRSLKRRQEDIRIDKK